VQAGTGDPRVLWRFSDGKAGHDAQSLGLVQALQTRCEIALYELPGINHFTAFAGWLTGRYTPGGSLPEPDLLVGAGHATHWGLLAARRACGGRAVVLMQPSLPNSLFDLCLIPEHDNPNSAANVLVTRGVLNTMRASQNRADGQGLILLGGPSPHYHWNDDEVLEQIKALMSARPQLQWQVMSSRRTPATTVALLGKQKDLTVLAANVSDNSVAAALASAAEVRVTEDSVSMIYEALTSAAPTGLLAVTRSRANRITAGVDALVARGWVAAPGDWRELTAPPPLDEAGRCADWIVEQWLNKN